MSISHGELLVAAVRMAAGAAEVDSRTAISRAYYAAYHCCDEFHKKLKQKGEPPRKKMGMHAQLAHQLSNPRVQDPVQADASRAAGFELQTMKAERVRADYKLKTRVTSADAQAVIEQAAMLIKSI